MPFPALEIQVWTPLIVASDLPLDFKESRVPDKPFTDDELNPETHQIREDKITSEATDAKRSEDRSTAKISQESVDERKREAFQNKFLELKKYL